ncbi:uncharacterized protein LOC143232077 isoform X2 [Tachypleus tridentatus]|uniref:uncharacterized protein LOC143232077 isoform X2 n=1 Tax=Tachypleus tridentatus TaxID=6853 RepID=UPI003FD3FF29
MFMTEFEPFKKSAALTRKLEDETEAELEPFKKATALTRKSEDEVEKSCQDFNAFFKESSEKIQELTIKFSTCLQNIKRFSENRRKASENEKDVLSPDCTGYCVTSKQNDEVVWEMQDLHMKVKKAIEKSSFSVRRSLLQLNNLANQHQLQLLPYLEMKAQLNKMLEEQKEATSRCNDSIDTSHKLPDTSQIQQTNSPAPFYLQDSFQTTSFRMSPKEQSLGKSSPFSYKWMQQDIAVEDSDMHLDEMYLRLPHRLKSIPSMSDQSQLLNSSQAKDSSETLTSTSVLASTYQ